MEEDKLSLESLLSEAAGNKPATPPPPPVVEEPVVEEPVVEEPVVEEPVVEEPKKKPTEKPNPMKEVRDKLSQEQKEKQKISGAVKRFTTGSYDFKLKDFVVDGEVDYDALNAKMDEIDLKVKAEGRGISPEIQAEIDRIEKDKLELEKDKLRVGMDRALTELQLERGLKAADVNNFFKDALAVKKNPYQWLGQGGSLDDLYFLVYRDKLVKKQISDAVEAEKVKWQEQATRQTKVPASNPASPKAQTQGATDGLSFEQMLEEAAKKRAR